ncbi:unnamed protein product [Diatraea saccharalis]|uniref:BEN domain-containing protein n=1 Tax=Diatraea saccharalis TaxID=40085 RepID=A0A9N9WC99_9NEOP|nr:unnamed protein product [Diatraea saccharalis]
MTMKTYKNCLKKQHETAIKALENKKATKSTAHLGIQRSPTKHITITVDINYVVGMLQAMNKLVTSFKLVKDVPQQSKEDQNETLKAKSVDTIGEESCRSDDSNRSGDNVLISNKYVNIENNKQEAIANEQPELTTKNSDTQAKNTTNEASSTENEKDMQGTVKNYDTKQDETTNVTKQEKILSETQKQDTVKNTPLQKKDNKMQSNKGSNDLNDENEWVPIGSGKTFIHKEKFRKVKWTSYTIATRSLLLALFPRRTLATHSLTGKKSPAFQNKPAKMCLDPKKISDIIIEVMDRFDVKENLVRSIITTKCADESKMFRTRMEKMKKAVPKQQNIKKQNECDKENN